jgi:hypothetical protein
MPRDAFGYRRGWFIVGIHTTPVCSGSLGVRDFEHGDKEDKSSYRMRCGGDIMSEAWLASLPAVVPS